MKRKTGLDIVKNYNKKIKKTKSKLYYVPVNVDIYNNLTSSEKSVITKILKKFDLRKEIEVKGGISKNTRNLLKALEKISNKRTNEFREKYENYKLKMGGVEIPEQSKNVYKSEAPKDSKIDFKKITSEGIKEKSKNFLSKIKGEFYNEKLERMRKNYISSLSLVLSLYPSGFDDIDLVKYIENMDLDDFYKAYLENVDSHIVFTISPPSRKKHEQELPLPESDLLFKSVAIGLGYAEEKRQELLEDIKNYYDLNNMSYNNIVKKIENLDINDFYEKYTNDDLDFNFNENIEDVNRRLGRI